MASRETSGEVAAGVKTVGPRGQRRREVGRSGSEAEQTKLDERLGSGVWVVSQ